MFNKNESKDNTSLAGFRVGEKYLLNCDNWFLAPDGQSYKAVHGTVACVYSDDEIMGVKTNRHSSDWFIVIGNMIISGCQVHYCIKTEKVNFNQSVRDVEHDGVLSHRQEYGCRTYNADGDT